MGESPRRGETFVTRKITRGLTRIDAGLEECLYLGNLDTKRDWGHAKDYIEMQWLMLQQRIPEDFVISTGRTETVRKFIEISAEKIGWNQGLDKPPIIWEGEGVHEIGKRPDNEKVIIKIDKRYFRPTEVDLLIGDSTKAKEKLGWTPKTNLEELIEGMIECDKRQAYKESILRNEDFYKERNQY